MITGVAIHSLDPEEGFYFLSMPFRHNHLLKLLGEKGILSVGMEQGFVTDETEFLTRDEAERLARDTGQLTENLIGSVLTSEDLW